MYETSKQRHDRYNDTTIIREATRHKMQTRGLVQGRGRAEWGSGTRGADKTYKTKKKTVSMISGMHYHVPPGPEPECRVERFAIQWLNAGGGGCVERFPGAGESIGRGTRRSVGKL